MTWPSRALVGLVAQLDRRKALRDGVISNPAPETDPALARSA